MSTQVNLILDPLYLDQQSALSLYLTPFQLEGAPWPLAVLDTVPQEAYISLDTERPGYRRAHAKRSTRAAEHSEHFLIGEILGLLQNLFKCRFGPKNPWRDHFSLPLFGEGKWKVQISPAILVDLPKVERNWQSPLKVFQRSHMDPGPLKPYQEISEPWQATRMAPPIAK